METVAVYTEEPASDIWSARVLFLGFLSAGMKNGVCMVWMDCWLEALSSRWTKTTPCFINSHFPSSLRKALRSIDQHHWNSHYPCPRQHASAPLQLPAFTRRLSLSIRRVIHQSSATPAALNIISPNSCTRHASTSCDNLRSEEVWWCEGCCDGEIRFGTVAYETRGAKD